MANIWEKDTFLNDNILYTFNKDIIEYDMKEAGFSLIQEFNLLPKDTITELKELGKEKRKIKIGKIQIKNDELKNNLKLAFKEARRIFFELNKLDDSEVISIKKDAIFVTRYCKHTTIGKYIEFRPKNYYTSYIRLGKRLELYYNPETMGIKGIGEENVEYHKKYMIKFLRLYFKKMETEDSKIVLDFTRAFIDKYKSRDLELGYYRNFNEKSDFTIIGDDNKYMQYWEDEKDQVDISYNYFNILLKLIKIPL